MGTWDNNVTSKVMMGDLANRFALYLKLKTCSNCLLFFLPLSFALQLLLPERMTDGETEEEEKRRRAEGARESAEARNGSGCPSGKSHLSP